MAKLSLPIHTERLILREHREEDAVALQAIYGREAVTVHLLDEPWSIETAEAKVRERMPRTGLDMEAAGLALVIELDGAVIGDLSLWTTDDDGALAEIGWVLDPEYGGRGLALEAAKAVLDVAFDVYGVHRVVAQMDGRNTASARLAERIGLQREGLHRQSWWSKGEWTDTIVYAQLHSDRD